MPSFKKSSLVKKATVASEAREDVKGSQDSLAWAVLGSPGLRGEAAVGLPENTGRPLPTTFQARLWLCGQTNH